MEKNPKKLSPEVDNIRTYPGQLLNTGTLPMASDLLPSIFKTETNKKLLSAIVEDLFQPSSIETLNFAVGRPTASISNADYLPHPTARRQLESGLVVFTEDGVETLSSDDVATAWNLNQRTTEAPVAVSILDLPIDPDKYLNWFDYYWVEERMPLVFLDGGAVGFSVSADVLGQTRFTLPAQRNGRQIDLKNGMRIVFQQNTAASIEGDLDIEFISTGADEEVIPNFEPNRFNTLTIEVILNGVPKFQDTDYIIAGNSIKWINVPAVGSQVLVHLPDYFITFDDGLGTRPWLVAGVGTESGIKLLGITHQNTSSAYSKLTASLWDQTAVTWDRIEWDGNIAGINSKHYILQQAGAENRNAHSRVNVWIHRNTIQTVAEFLDLSFSDIASSTSRALRPIVEFENTLEQYNQGSKFRAWVNAAEELTSLPDSYLNLSVRQLNIAIGIAKTNTVASTLIGNPRVLWLTAGPYQNKIINFRSVNNIVRSYVVETPNDGETTVISSLQFKEPMAEYYWVNGVATKSTYRLTPTQQPQFELYNKDGIRLSDYQISSGFKPSITNSTIIKLQEGTTVDSESGYKLNFVSSQFTELSTDNTAKNSMYNILYNHTQQDSSYYSDSVGNQQTVSGPYSFRRLGGKPVNEELSNGYKRAWFKLKSWACKTQEVVDSTVITLDSTAWPTYNWAVQLANGNAQIIFVDDLVPVVDNYAVGARGQTITFDLYDTANSQLTATIAGFGIAAFSVNTFNNQLTFTVPADAPDVLMVNCGALAFKIRVIDIKTDPRFVKIKLDGIDIDFTVAESEYSITVVGTGTLELKHQGNMAAGEHLTAIPGFDLNPLQLSSLGEFSPARLIKGLSNSVKINTNNNLYAWSDCPQIKSLDGIYMVDNSAIRAAWANFKLNPGLQDVVVSRSLANWRWYRRFIAKLEENNKIYDITTDIQSSLNRILEELLLGVTYSSADAVTGMAFTTSAMTQLNHVATGQSSFLIGQDIELYVDNYGPDHVYVYVNDQLQLHNIDYTIDAASSSVVFKTAPVINSLVDVYHAAESSIFSGIPASPSKLGLGGLFVPKMHTESWGAEERTFIQRHDGSRITAYVDPATGTATSDYALNAIILELEKRIYNGCLNQVGVPNEQRSFRNHAAKPVSESQARSQLEWFAVNSIDFRDRSDYELSNEWTWNYDGKSWRGLYLQFFGTYELHSAPWEALGFDSAPAWWSTHYAWTDSIKRAALVSALKHGMTSEPGTPITTNPLFVRNFDSFPVTQAGMLVSPASWGVSTPTASEAQQPWVIGSYSPAELAWRRSIAGTWSNVLHIIDDYTLATEFFDSAINPFTVHSFNNSTAAKGYNSVAPSQFFQQRPTIGIGAVIFEAYREFNLLGETPLLSLMSIAVKPTFSMGGFTDSDVSMKMNYTKYQIGSYVPNEDFNITLSNGVSTEILRYTSVRIESDGNGFRVYGFDPGQRYFKVLTPTAAALTTGNPSSRRQLSTAYGTFIEYLNWNSTPVTVPYGSYIESKQDLITLLMGLGEYQTSMGLVLDMLNNRGTVTDWKQAALDALSWIDERWGSDHYCVVGVVTEDGLKFKHTMGALDSMDADLGRVGKIMYANGKSALASELLITREFETATDKITPTTSEQIVFVKFNTRNYDQIFFVNTVTKFGDLIVDLQTNNRLETLAISGRRTYNWTGRPNANGVIPQAQTLVPGFDTLVSDILTSHMPERVAFDTFKTSIARTNIIPSKNSVIFDIIQDDTSAYLYRQGLQTATGTNLAIDALFRSSNIDAPGKQQDISVNEQWMFSNGEFGKTSGKKIWEIELKKSDVKNNRQIVRFTNPTSSATVDYASDNIIDLIGAKDPRWITIPNNVNFSTIPRELIDVNYSNKHKWLPSAGIANLADAEIKLLTPLDITISEFSSLSKIVVVDGATVVQHKLFTTQSYSRYIDYKIGDLAWNSATFYVATANIVGSATSSFDSTLWEPIALGSDLLPSIWVSDYNGQGWNVLQTTLPKFIEEICPNAATPGLNESKVSFANAHGLSAGDRVIIAGSGDGNYDAVHLVKDVVDDYNILIAARSTSDLPVYNLVCFELVTVKFDTYAQVLSSTVPWSNGMKAYVDGGDTEGTWTIYTYTNGNFSVAYSAASQPMIDSASITKVELFDYSTQDLIARVEVYDPYKGLTIDEVAQYIEFKQEIDPASYNVTDLGETDDYVAMPWGNAHLGTLWWDLNEVRYVEYEQGTDIQYRAANWGAKFANSTVSVYEWTATDTLPTVEDAVDAKLNTASSVPGQVRYSTAVEIDPLTGIGSVRYYYWKRNVNVLPGAAQRPYSAAAIASVLNDPDANAVAWFSPIDTNVFLLSNVSAYFSAADRIILRVEQNAAAEQIHSNAVLVTEGMNGDVINDYLYSRVSASVSGRDNYRETYKIREHYVGAQYRRGDYVYVAANGVIVKTSTYANDDYPILQNYADTREDVIAVRRSFNGADHNIYFVPTTFTARTFAEDIARGKLLHSAAAAIILDPLAVGSNDYYAVLNTRRRIPDLRLHPLRRYGNGYTPKPQSWFNDITSARRVLAVAANAYLLKIDVVSKPNWDMYLKVYKPLSGNWQLNLEKYWTYVDYVLDDYQFGNESVVIDDTTAISSLDAAVTNFAIKDANGITVEAYNKNGNELTLAYRKNGTIQLLSNVWNGSDLWDATKWDLNGTAPWDGDGSEVIESVLRALRTNIFTEEDTGYFNLVFFALVKESLAQIKNADWVIKTTYLDVAQLSNNDLTQVSTYFNKRNGLVTTYLNEVKPFHSKLIDTNQFNKSTQNIAVEFTEGIQLTIVDSTANVTQISLSQGSV